MDKGYPVTAQPHVVVVPPILFGENPMQVTCGNCQQTVITTTTSENGACAYIAALVMCFIFCPCFWIPLVMDSCRDVQHTCPSCGALLGTYKRL